MNLKHLLSDALATVDRYGVKRFSKQAQCLKGRGLCPTLEEPPCIDLKALEVNLIGVMYTTNLAFHYLPKNPGSEKVYQPSTSTEGQDSANRDRHILLIGSMAGIFPMAAQVQYCTAKYAILRLYHSLICTAFIKGIFINLFMLYFTDTPIWSTFGREILVGVPLGEIEDVVDTDTRLMARTLNGAKFGGIWEVYGQDFDDFGKCSASFARLEVNSWGNWMLDLAAALLYAFKKWLKV
ncbi:hypothetical protein BOTNAR_0350g00090 [Botryotinia narcissicola]|uniref:Uncharacterized protein n=1 Tax=Botryotinia narcissicola TaxID=278944 RepID=A0A4Z1HS31_9HELO|nr:hypothetical protein BOTNAR_0350g00090 [Botryotinia narcissicola]